MSRGYVLVVDDDPLLAEAAMAVLRRQDYETCAVENGRRALRAIGERVPDVILLDAMMPGLDGFEVLKTLKANPVLMQIPVLMMTARRAQNDVMRAKQLGAHGYIAKPFEPDDLLQRVSAAFQRQRQRQSSVAPTAPRSIGAVESPSDTEFLD